MTPLEQAMAKAKQRFGELGERAEAYCHSRYDSTFAAGAKARNELLHAAVAYGNAIDELAVIVDRGPPMPPS